ncbi:MAG: hypothetical protein ACXAC2_03695 [Candidatus Kariarchaeaceae archaeon]|jgi:hypothetical protein
MNNSIYKYASVNPGRLLTSRIQVKNFKDSESMHKFLNTGSNALYWNETTDSIPVKSGKYVYAGQAWHNMKNMDASELAHLS